MDIPVMRSVITYRGIRDWVGVLFLPPQKILADENRTVTGRNALLGVLDNRLRRQKNEQI